MNKKNKTHICFVLLSVLMLVPAILHSEFYKYVDKSGKTCFVDDLSKIPEEYMDQARIYKEKYDDLPEEQKKVKIEEDRRREQKLKEARQLEEEQIARENYLKSLELKVIIQDNRVLVPVTLSDGIKEIQVNLILDTGASIIAIHRDVANRLFLSGHMNSKARLAGGKEIDTQIVKLSYVKVGPIKKTDIMVGIIEHEGHAVNHNGLLGMNFLRNLEYSIDFKNQVLRWKPEAEKTHER